MKRLWWAFVILSLAGVAALYLREGPALMEIRGTGQIMQINASMIEAVTKDASLGSPGIYVRLRDAIAGPFGDLTTASDGDLIDILVCGQLVQQPRIIAPLYDPRFILTFAETAAADRVFAQLNTGDCSP